MELSIPYCMVTVCSPMGDQVTYDTVRVKPHGVKLDTFEKCDICRLSSTFLTFAQKNFRAPGQMGCISRISVTHLAEMIISVSSLSVN